MRHLSGEIFRWQIVNPLGAEKAAGYCTFGGVNNRLAIPNSTDTNVQTTDGSLGGVTEGSTRPIALVVHHAGISKVKRYRFAA
jgi:hypothetical protein